jgi:hypothetical protein
MAEARIGALLGTGVNGRPEAMETSGVCVICVYTIRITCIGGLE